MSIEQQFVENNRKYLLNVMDNAPEVFSGDRAAGIKTVRALFAAVLEDNDYSYLPLCLLYIHDGTKILKGKEIQNDENFALNSLLWFHEHRGSALNSYVLAYALRYDLQIDKCEELLLTLAKEDFSSALIGLGDLSLSRGKREDALTFYKRASKLGHFSGWGKIWEVYKNNGSILHKAAIIAQYPSLHIRRMYHFIFTAPINEKFLCLEFYFSIDFSSL